MGGLNVKKDKNVFSANWEANLLVKDRLSGKLKRLRFQNYPNRLKELLEEEEKEKSKIEIKDEILKLMAPLEQESLLKIAPLEDHFLPLKLSPTQSAGAKAEWHFHPEDKQQVETIAKTMPTDDSKKYSLEKIVSTLIEKQHLNFDPENKEKFTNIIFDFFRNRKRFLTVRELLLESVHSSQGQLNDRTVDAVLSVVKSLKAKVEEAGGLVVRLADYQIAPVQPIAVAPVPALMPASDIKPWSESNREFLKKEPQAEIMAVWPELKSELPTSRTDASPALVGIETPPATVLVASPLPKNNFVFPSTISSTSKKEIDTPPAERADSQISITRPVEIGTAKKSVTDVTNKKEIVFKAVPQSRHVLTGPVGELEAMTLENFRRMGSDLPEIVERLGDKIKVLEHDSFTKKTQGIEAWRRSETHQFYLRLGLESLQTGQDVSQLISQKQQAGQKTLTMEEFSAISDLNRKLRF